MPGDSRKWLRARFQKQWGKSPLEGESAYERSSRQRRMGQIRIYHDVLEVRRGLDPAKQNKEGIDEITWNDLEMDEVFWRVNNTKSFIGEQVLYHRLHGVQCGQDWGRYERQLAFLADNEERRTDIQMRLHAIGKREEAYALSAFLMNPKLWRIEKGWFLRLMQILLLLSGAASILWNHILCYAALAVVVLTNLMICVYMKQRYEGYLGALGSLQQIYEFARWLTGIQELREPFGSEELSGAVEALKGLSKRITGFDSRKAAGMSGDLFGIVNDYLWGITLLDIASFNRIMKVISDKQAQVFVLVRFAGEVDAAAAAASFRAGTAEWCVPQLAEAAEIRVERLVHPLLEHPVENDFVLENRAIITGANASGKSTFMKALAVNAILAQTIHTCTAASYSAPRMHVMTCMSLRDDVLSGESYYFREAKYLKRMLDQMEKKERTLFVLDEILRGTNTRERLAASSAILAYMADAEDFVLVATHDMELAQSRGYKRCYFESRIEGADISFDYRIHAGAGGASNAIALLSALHFPDCVVCQARKNLEAAV